MTLLPSRPTNVPGRGPDGITFLGEDLARYPVVHSRTVAVLFVDTRPVDAIVFHHDLLGADDPKRFFRLQM
jgi:hypothetical protein